MKNIVELSYDQAHAFVDKNKQNGFFWKGYDIIKWSPSNKGFTDVNGMYRNGKWGFANTYKMTDGGTWMIPSKYE